MTRPDSRDPTPELYPLIKTIMIKVFAGSTAREITRLNIALLNKAKELMKSEDDLKRAEHSISNLKKQLKF